MSGAVTEISGRDMPQKALSILSDGCRSTETSRTHANPLALQLRVAKHRVTDRMVVQHNILISLVSSPSISEGERFSVLNRRLGVISPAETLASAKDHSPTQ